MDSKEINRRIDATVTGLTEVCSYFLGLWP